MTPSRLLRLAVVTALVGIGGGVAGLVVSLALHGIQHLAYGYSSGTFLTAIVTTPGWQRVLALLIAGIVGAVGWWLLRRFGPAVVSVEKAVEGQRMPRVATALNVAIQIVIVGLGASIGREVAPRELGAMFAQWLTDRAGVSARERRILIACGAGAGLAAVYDVPIGGALFAVEVLLAELSLATAVPAFATAGIATLVGWVVVPQQPLYRVPDLHVAPSFYVWSLIAGPVIGILALGWSNGSRWLGERRPTGAWILLVMPLVFLGVGLLSVPLPWILGNGRALGQVAFSDALPLLLVAVVVLAKAAATTATIASGAAGGTLTPSVALGAGTGLVLGAGWALIWPGQASTVAAFAFVGAAAFLTTTMRAPFTALILVVEFTHQGTTLLVPTALAVAGAAGVAYLARRRARLAGVA